jgi:hypothetical protein
VLYAKHHQQLSDALSAIQSSQSDLYRTLAPFVERFDDVSPFQEIRTTSAVPIDRAVWILTTQRKGHPPRPEMPALDEFKTKYGPISMSYWHRTHQMEMLGESQYINLNTGADGWPVEFSFMGEHYWEQTVGEMRSLQVALPKHEKELDFRFVDPEKRTRHTGPWRFVDVARILFKTLQGTGEEIDRLLPDRLISSF